MSNSTMTKPDLDFIRKLKASGGDSVKKCFQCATCSVVCKLSPDDRPFPRKEMIWAQWGQREKLVSDPDVWLCHQCNDCSTYCPRGARPGDVLAAIRRFSVEHYAVPAFMGKLVGNPDLVLLALAIPAVLVLAAHYFSAGGQFVFAPQHDEIHFAEFMSHMWLNVFFSAFTAMAFLGGFLGVLRLWKDLEKSRPGPAKMGLVSAMIGTFVELVLHEKFATCGTSRGRRISHMLIFYGFAGLFVVTGIVVIMLLIAPDSYPIKFQLEGNTFGFAMKVAGNLFGFMLLAGSLLAIYNRLTNEDQAGKSSYFDWFFLLLVFGVGLSGLATEATRYWDIRAAAYPVYYVHLVIIYALLVFLPYSKFAHMLYRFTALTYARQIGLYEPAADKDKPQPVSMRPTEPTPAPEKTKDTEETRETKEEPAE